MPGRPDFSQHRPDPRFDRYRERVGRLFRDKEEVGLVLVEVEPYAEQAGGHLWWTRWDTSRDVLWVWTLVDGTFSDMLVREDAADEELRDYDAKRFEHYGESCASSGRMRRSPGSCARRSSDGRSRYSLREAAGRLSRLGPFLKSPVKTGYGAS